MTPITGRIRLAADDATPATAATEDTSTTTNNVTGPRSARQTPSAPAADASVTTTVTRTAGAVPTSRTTASTIPVGEGSGENVRDQADNDTNTAVTVPSPRTAATTAGPTATSPPIPSPVRTQATTRPPTVPASVARSGPELGLVPVAALVVTVAIGGWWLGRARSRTQARPDRPTVPATLGGRSSDAQPAGDRERLIAGLMQARDALAVDATASLTALEALAGVGVEVLDPKGAPFDPSTQQALDSEVTSEVALQDTVADVERVGYFDRKRGVVVRQPEVVVYRLHHGRHV
jgi:hypothetical protein